MSRPAPLSISDVNPQNILRTISAVIAELGAFSTAMMLLETIQRMTDQDGAGRLAEILADDFPLYGEIVDSGFSPADIQTILDDRTNRLADKLQNFSTIVAVGIESAILDRLCLKLPQTRFYLIPHAQAVDTERVLANFPANVSLIDVKQIMGLGGARSVLLAYAFCRSGDDCFIYPVTFRAVGPDVKSAYNRIVGLNMLSGYNRYLADMAPLYATSRFFTNQFEIL
jgi:hypothetical protein